ncbi:ABC-F family ATP-binding cassette domain-containing protein [Chitinophagaceae bacterium LB-8]|uniref:ABC-F family ATP-binding cassette domain-containing protein n=1 Tax=Paraflavisolibacter caeni TaxID=2982496 RepID=A0A9X2XSK2_9BACT|nr:ABC-F family ATP-binding cassette domain-containing protein [Paraflavisolibacter caeni]MCU7547471.1 ABC-F family ATP-binding cassette domain-containing protein [Paraflavisolibacter caeni]
MHYVSAENISKSFGIKPLFDNISFHISEGDKIALVARNGAGKSTLLKIIAGKEFVDEGKVWTNKNVDVAFFEQEPKLEENKSVLDNIFHHSHPVINAIKQYEAAVDTGNEQQIAACLVQMDEMNAWDFEAKVKQIFGKLNIHHLQQNVTTLSGGQRKRVALAKTLIDIGFEHKHVLLIMDEPTNHLDVQMVEWLEHYLNKENVTLLLVTHDRYFLDAACDEIWELDRSEMFVYKGDYANFLEKKAAREDSEAASIDKARNLYRKELEWMRKQPKARTTKSKSRIDAFYEVEKKAKQQIQEEQLQLQAKMNRLGGKVAELKKVYKSFGEKVILQGFDYTFKKGERVGIVGKNGAGKSTFINIIQGIEQPDSGKINIGDTVVFGNYSQQGLEIKEDMRVIEYVKNIAENFPLANGGSLSASQFLNLFLFPPEQQYTYISKLSGGEKRRLHLLTILFRNPNFLILDEPTNDLDLPTLAVLENFLSEFGGCLLIVSHDRYFMDRLVDHLFVFEGEGQIRDFPGNYSQYRDWQKAQEDEIKEEKKPEPIIDNGNTATKSKKKLSYKEQREFDMLEKEIALLEKERQEIYIKLNDSSLPYDELQNLSERLGVINNTIDEKEMRWLELSEMSS